MKLLSLAIRKQEVQQMEMILAGAGVLALLSVAVAIRAITSCNGGDGSICKDGWFSRSSGRGTCSWHGGVGSE
jgi:hypothetical protein